MYLTLLNLLFLSISPISGQITYPDMCRSPWPDNPRSDCMYASGTYTNLILEKRREEVKVPRVQAH